MVRRSADHSGQAAPLNRMRTGDSSTSSILLSKMGHNTSVNFFLCKSTLTSERAKIGVSLEENALFFLQVCKSTFTSLLHSCPFSHPPLSVRQTLHFFVAQADFQPRKRSPGLKGQQDEPTDGRASARFSDEYCEQEGATLRRSSVQAFAKVGAAGFALLTVKIFASDKELL